MPATYRADLSTDEYCFLVLVYRRGQIPNEYSYLFSETNIENFNICLHSFYQMQTNMNKCRPVIKICLIFSDFKLNRGVHKRRAQLGGGGRTSKLQCSLRLKKLKS